MSGKKVVVVVLGLMAVVLSLVVLGALLLAKEQNARTPRVGAGPVASALSSPC